MSYEQSRRRMENKIGQMRFYSIESRRMPNSNIKSVRSVWLSTERNLLLNALVEAKKNQKKWNIGRNRILIEDEAQILAYETIYSMVYILPKVYTTHFHSGNILTIYRRYRYRYEPYIHICFIFNCYNLNEQTSKHITIYYYHYPYQLLLLLLLLCLD